LIGQRESRARTSRWFGPRDPFLGRAVRSDRRGAGSATRRRPSSRSTRRNSSAFMRAVIDRIDRERAVRVWQEPIRVGHHPLTANSEGG
jgi:hypothetical protein